MAGSLEIYCDGAVLINPGGSGGWGFVALAGSETVHRAHGALQGVSNNEAEYQAVIAALEWLGTQETSYAGATIYSDSQLAINQITGEWAINAAHLGALAQRVRRMAKTLPYSVAFEWVPRERNIEADIEAGRGLADALGLTEEQAEILRAAAGRRIKALKACKKSKGLLYRQGLVTNYIVHEDGEKVRYSRGLKPEPKKKTEQETKKWLV